MTMNYQLLTEGVDYIGPSPSILIFAAGQTVGDIQCAEITILDDSTPQGERSFNITVGNGGGTISDVGDAGSIRHGGVRANPDVVTIDIDVDINDCELLYAWTLVCREILAKGNMYVCNIPLDIAAPCYLSHTIPHYIIIVTQFGLSELTYLATEGPASQVSICVNILLGSLSSDTTVHLLTPLSGALTGKTTCS